MGDVQGQISQIVIVGAGDCGARAALAIRHRGYSGNLILVSNEPIAPYERPPLSKALLTDMDFHLHPIATYDQLSDLGIHIVSGRASAIDRAAHEIVVGDRKITYDRLLLAVGSRARRPAIAGPDIALTLRDASDAYDLREQLLPGVRVLVVGGGFIGLEVAASAVSRGCTVTVVEFAHRTMSRVVPLQLAEIASERHRRAGVDLRCGIGVDHFESRASDNYIAVLSDGSSIEIDLVVAGVGATPNTELAATAGLRIENGIAVDRQLRTEDETIFAAGDCCSFPHPLYDDQRVRLEAWRNAVDHAEVVAGNILGESAIVETVPWFWSDQYELRIQIVGLHYAAAYDVMRPRSDGNELRFGIDHSGRVVSASGVAEGTALARDITLAERLILQRVTPKATVLADPSVDLRELLDMKL